MNAKQLGVPLAGLWPDVAGTPIALPSVQKLINGQFARINLLTVGGGRDQLRELNFGITFCATKARIAGNSSSGAWVAPSIKLKLPRSLASAPYVSGH